MAWEEKMKTVREGVGGALILIGAIILVCNIIYDINIDNINLGLGLCIFGMLFLGRR